MDNGFISPSIFSENRERCGTKILSTGDLEQINGYASRTLIPRKWACKIFIFCCINYYGTDLWVVLWVFKKRLFKSLWWNRNSISSKTSEIRLDA